MNETNTTARTRNFRNRLERRIFNAWFLRRSLPLLVIELVILLFATAFFAHYVFVEQVISNAVGSALGNPFEMIGYLWIAFLKTRLITKTVIIALVVGGLFLLRDINRSILNYASLKKRAILNRLTRRKTNE